MKTRISRVGRLALLTVSLLMLAAPAFAQCQMWTWLNVSTGVPYPVSHWAGGPYGVSVWSPAPIPDLCIPYLSAWTTEGWVSLSGQTFPGSSTLFWISVSQNRDIARHADVNVDLWLVEEYPPNDYYLVGMTDVGIDQENGAPTILIVDPADILIPPNRTVTFRTDMVEFMVELKYRYRPDPQQQWSPEYTTPQYYVDYRGIWTLYYTSEHVTCCSGYYEFTAIRDANGGDWQSIYVPVYLGPSEESLGQNSVVMSAISATVASNPVGSGVKWVGNASRVREQAWLVRAPLRIGAASRRLADNRRGQRGESTGVAHNRIGLTQKRRLTLRA